MKIVPFVAAGVVLALGTQAAGAAGWRQITSSGGGNTDQVGLLRTADGTLHVAWRRSSGASSADVMHTAISAGGGVGATSPIVSGWAEVQNPALVVDPTGLRVFFGGIRTLAPGEPNQELNTATSPDGSAWSLQPGSVVSVGAQAYGNSVAATTLPSGNPLEAWAGTLGTWVHSGLSYSTPNHDYQAPLGHYGYDANIAADSAGRAVLAWYSNATGHLGVFAQDVATDGSPIGSAANMPGTGNMHVGMIGRTPLVARAGGGFYVAYATGYPALNRIRLWHVGAGARLVARTNRNGNTTATIAADPKGRLWVAWTNVVGSSPHVFARRSNRAATVFGAIVDGGRPRGASSIYKLDASATRGSLDVFGNTSIGVSSTTATWYRRLLPGLTLVASPARLHRGRTTQVTFRVLDAGDPVAGARVAAGGKAGVTSAKGRVTLVLGGRDRSIGAKTTAKGYVGARIRLRVLPR